MNRSDGCSRRCFLDNQPFVTDEQLQRFWSEDDLNVVFDRASIIRHGCVVKAYEVVFVDGQAYRHDEQHCELVAYPQGPQIIGYPPTARGDVVGYLRQQGYVAQRPSGPVFRRTLEVATTPAREHEQDPER